MDAHTVEIGKLLKNERFIYHRQKPTFEPLRQSIQEGKPCEVVLDSHMLDNVEGFAPHRVVVVTDVDDKHVTFHDPHPEPRPNRKETVEHFKKAWLDALDEPELCIYSKINI